MEDRASGEPPPAPEEPEKVICGQCQHENEEDAAFCEECGAKLELHCPGCGQPVKLGAKFCKKCGFNLGQPPSPAPKTRFASPQAYTPKYLAEKILTSRLLSKGSGSR